MVIIFGTKNFERLIESVTIPNVAVYSGKVRFLPIYKVKISYNG